MYRNQNVRVLIEKEESKAILHKSTPIHSVQCFEGRRRFKEKHFHVKNDPKLICFNFHPLNLKLFEFVLNGLEMF